MTDTAKLLEQIRNIRRSIDSMNQQLNALEDSLFQLASPYSEQKANLNTNFNQDKEAWLTVREVCEALKISQATFYRLVNEGGLPEGFEFSPRNKRWRLSDIEAWQTAKKTQAQEVPQIVQVQRRVKGSKVKNTGSFKMLNGGQKMKFTQKSPRRLDGKHFAHCIKECQVWKHNTQKRFEPAYSITFPEIES